MKKVLLIFLMFLTNSFFGQDRYLINTKVVLIKSIDTVHYDVLARSKFSGHEYINEASYCNGIVYKKEGKRKAWSANSIKYLEYIDLDSVKRKFVNPLVIDRSFKMSSEFSMQADYLVEEIVTGKISWYKKYRTYVYSAGVDISECLLINGKLTCVNSYRKLKKLMIELSSDKNELVEIIEATKFSGSKTKRNQQILGLINKYNSYYE